MFSMVQSAIFHFISNKMGFWLERKVPCSPSEKCYQYTHYAEPLKSVPVVLHTHLFIAAPATVVKREAQSVYVTYSSVRAWMDGSQTEVKEQERDVEE